MFLIEFHNGHRIMYRGGGRIVLDTSEPLKLSYLEPWQMSRKYLKKIKRKSPFGVLLNLHKEIWLSPAVSPAFSGPSTLQSQGTEPAASSFRSTHSIRGQVTNPYQGPCCPGVQGVTLQGATGGDVGFPESPVTWHHDFLKWEQKPLSQHSLDEELAPNQPPPQTPRNFESIAIWCINEREGST